MQELLDAVNAEIKSLKQEIRDLKTENEALHAHNAGLEEKAAFCNENAVDNFINAVLSNLKKRGYNTDNCDGDDGEAIVFANWIDAQIQDAVFNEASKRKAFEWIPVEKSLPQDWQQCLVVQQDETGSYPIAAVRSNGNWLNLEKMSVIANSVKFWMPLPPPPIN